MTILLLFGLFAALYVLWLLIGLAVHALPLYAGLATGFWLHAHGQGLPASILGAILVGAATLAIGRILFDTVRSPLLRLAIAALFVIPAAFAGYHAIYGIAGMALGSGVTLTMLSFIGAMAIAAKAWTEITSAPVRQVLLTGPTQTGCSD
ncbi:MAG: hypothetical protein WCS75_01175 [Sphingomonas sp.]|jgi:hypothetical protein|uniref:hypothetical protein n=1 Tax=Alphaproteobacteria TaxID=28211 RepID=UPI001AE4983E|nr:hypothetical protein [Sphingomonas sp. BE137]MDR6849948.1 ABC-type transport system involved in multi-copper enzyme maturation permease subunit [Sphingomonas sp. BE137]